MRGPPFVVAALAIAAVSPALAGETSLSPVALSADPVVARFVDEALAQNPEVARARVSVEADRQRVPQVGTLPDPTLTLGIQNDGFQSIQIGKMDTSYWEVLATQPFPWPGKLGARERVAMAQASVAEAQLARVRLNTTAEVERAYVDLLLVRGQLELLGKLEVLWMEAEVMARTRYEVGQGAQSDLLRAQLERTRLRQQRIVLESAERTRVQAINSLRVRPLDEPIAAPRPLAGLLDPPVRSAEEAVADAERRSPDLAIASLTVDVADRRVDSARKDWLPDFAITAGVMPRGQIEPMWTVQLGVTIPIFGGTKQSKAVDESLSRREAESQGESALRLQVRLRAEERRTLLAAITETLQLYRGGLLVQSDAAVRSTLSQYQVGKVSFPSVLEVLRGLVADEGGYLETLASAQRVAIADREVSLVPPAVTGVAAAGASMPGAGAGGGGGRSAAAGSSAPQQAAVPAATSGMAPGM